MSTRQIASSTGWQIASQLVMAALSIITTKFVALGLAKELAGNYNSAYGFLQLFGILADFGLYAVAVREVSRSENPEKTLGALITLRVIILMMSLSLALIFAWALPMWRGSPLPIGITIAALVPFFTLLAGILRTIFQVQYRMHYVFIAEVLQRIITVLLIGFFIFRGARLSTDIRVYEWFLGIGGIGAAALFLFSFVYGSRFMRIRPVFDTALLKSLLFLAAPYGLAYLCMALYRQLDVTLIALLHPDYELQNAYYGFAARMGDMAFLFPTFLLNSTLPVISSRDAAGEDTRPILGKTLLIVLFLASICSLFAFFWSRPLVLLLTTEAYLGSVLHPGTDTAFFLLSVPMFLNGLILYSFYTLLTRHAWRPLVIRLILGAVLSLSLNLYLIPRLGFVGAATTSIIVHSFLALLLFPLSLRVMPATISRVQILQWVTFSAIVAIGLFVTEPLLTGTISTALGLGIAMVSMCLLGLGLRLQKAFV